MVLGRLGLKSRVLILVFLAVALISGFQVWQQVVDFQGSLAAANDELYAQLGQTFENSLESELSYLSLAVRTLAENREIASLFAAEDRQALLEMLRDYNRELESEYGIAQFQFHQPPATSFLRLHLPDNYGDDLSGFRATVVEANRQVRPIVGLEVGRGGPGTRVVYPLHYQERHLGSVEFGGSINAALEALVDTYGIEYAVGIRSDVFERARRVETHANDVVRDGIVFYTFSSEDARQITAGFDLDALRSDLDGRQLHLHRIPMYDFSNTEIGHVLAIVDRTEMAAGMRQGLLVSVTVSLVIAFGALLVIFLVIRWSFRPLESVVTVMGEMAQGNLCIDVETNRHDETGMLLRAVHTTIHSMSEALGAVRDISQQVTGGSNELSDTAQQISDGASSQAASVEQVSSSIEEMESTIAHSADNAETTERIARQTADIAEGGADSVRSTVESMKSIVERIAVIEEIARNTNLLALNAAIEAARAGEAGKGFAVVASEVRKLAERSQRAAGEISELSRSSVEVAERTGELFEQMLPEIRCTADLVQEISASAREQRAGTGQIRNAVSQLDQTIQGNASVAEQMASMAEELSAQAQQLSETIGRFQIDRDAEVREAGRRDAEERDAEGRGAGRRDTGRQDRAGRLLIESRS